MAHQDRCFAEKWNGLLHPSAPRTPEVLAGPALLQHTHSYTSPLHIYLSRRSEGTPGFCPAVAEQLTGRTDFHLLTSARSCSATGIEDPHYTLLIFLPVFVMTLTLSQLATKRRALWRPLTRKHPPSLSIQPIVRSAQHWIDATLITCLREGLGYSSVTVPAHNLLHNSQSLHSSIIEQRD